MKKSTHDYHILLKDTPAPKILNIILGELGERICLASSLGAEDQVLTDMCLKINPNTRIFILDTGRLNPETYDVMDKTIKKYNMTYDVYFPQREAVEKMVKAKGPNLFYESIENRKECCGIRKVEPLGRALSSCDAWITGLRRTQSVTRASLNEAEWDETFKIMKFNPLTHWSEEDIWRYIKENNVPYNTLHDKGFSSIGCAPCTRAIKPDEDVRAGRWWWETPEQKECGLHVVDGKLVPIKKHDNIEPNSKKDNSIK